LKLVQKLIINGDASGIFCRNVLKEHIMQYFEYKAVLLTDKGVRTYPILLDEEAASFSKAVTKVCHFAWQDGCEIVEILSVKRTPAQ
jgi:hypothetical protein